MNTQQKVAFVVVFVVLALLMSIGTVIGIVMLQNKQGLDYGSDEFIISEHKPADTNMSEKDIEVKDGKIHYFAAGSGTCPPIVEKVEYTASTETYHLFVKEYHNQMCTMDYRGFTQTIEHKDGTEIPETAKIDVSR